MFNLRKITSSVLIAIVLLLPIAQTALAVPQMPCNFWGTATYEDGTDVPIGATVTVLYNGTPVANTTVIEFNNAAYYDLEIDIDDPDTPAVEGVPAGATVTFQIDGVDANETATCQSGASTQLGLTIPNSQLVGPTADFNSTPTASPLTKDFQDASIAGDVAIDTWAWNFGYPGGTSNVQNPGNVTFPSAGTFVVTLTVTDTNGLSDSISKAVPVGVTIARSSPTTQNLFQGNETTANIVIEDVDDLYAVDLLVDYDARIEGMGIELGPDWQDSFVVRSQVDNTTHQIRLVITLMGSGSINGNTVVVTITFRGVQPGTVPLTLTSTLWNSNSHEIAHTDQDSEIIVVPPTFIIQGVCQLQARTDHTGCQVEAGAQSATTPSTGEYEIIVPPGAYNAIASMSGYLYATASAAGVTGDVIVMATVELRAGDVNNDCIVNVLDLAAIGGCYEQASSCRAVADYNINGQIDMPDLIAASVNYGNTCPQPWTLRP